jgi:hypothetical protein
MHVPKASWRSFRWRAVLVDASTGFRRRFVLSCILCLALGTRTSAQISSGFTVFAMSHPNWYLHSGRGSAFRRAGEIRRFSQHSSGGETADQLLAAFAACLVAALVHENGRRDIAIAARCVSLRAYCSLVPFFSIITCTAVCETSLEVGRPLVSLPCFPCRRSMRPEKYTMARELE